VAWRVARSLDVLLTQLNTVFPRRSRASDGSIGDAAHRATVSDHNPDTQEVVRARDFTHDPAHGLDIADLASELVGSRDLRIKYIIANGRIMDTRAGNPWQWVPYTGSNPHTKHLHLSVVADARADDTSPWRLPMLGFTEEDEVALTPKQAEQLATIHHEVTLRLPSRSMYAGPKPWWDTVLGAALNAEGRAHEALIEGREARAAQRRLEERLPALIADAVRAVLSERPGT
jgi:hypothetical protein